MADLMINLAAVRHEGWTPPGRALPQSVKKPMLELLDERAPILEALNGAELLLRTLPQQYRAEDRAHKAAMTTAVTTGEDPPDAPDPQERQKALTAAESQHDVAIEALEAWARRVQDMFLEHGDQAQTELAIAKTNATKKAAAARQAMRDADAELLNTEQTALWIESITSEHVGLLGTWLYQPAMDAITERANEPDPPPPYGAAGIVPPEVHQSDQERNERGQITPPPEQARDPYTRFVQEGVA